MATLEQIASSSRTNKTNLLVPNKSGYAPSQSGKQVENLAGELLGISKSLGQVAVVNRDLNDKAAKKAALSNLSEMSKDMSFIDSQITPDSDLREVQVANQAIFQKYANVSFSDEDAQSTYDGIMVLQGGEAVAAKNAKFEIVQRQKDHAMLVDTTEKNLSIQLDNGVRQTVDMMHEYRGTLTAGGYETREGADTILAKSLNVGLNKYHKVNKNLNIYTNGKIDMDKQKVEFDKFNGSMATIDVNGLVTPTGGTTDAAVTSIINNWNTLKKSDLINRGSANFTKANLPLTLGSVRAKEIAEDSQRRSNELFDGYKDGLLDMTSTQMARIIDDNAETQTKYYINDDIEKQAIAFVNGSIGFEQFAIQTDYPHTAPSDKAKTSIVASKSDKLSYLTRYVKGFETNLRNEEDPAQRYQMVETLVGIERRSNGEVKSNYLHQTHDDANAGVYRNGNVMSDLLTASHFRLANGLKPYGSYINEDTIDEAGLIKRRMQEADKDPKEIDVAIENYLATAKVKFESIKPKRREFNALMAERGTNIREGLAVGSDRFATGSENIMFESINPSLNINNDVIDDAIEREMMVMSSDHLTSFMPFIADNVMIVRPEGVDNDKVVVERILADAVMFSKSKNIAPDDFFNNRYGFTQSRRNGFLVTTVDLVNNEGEIIHTFSYAGTDLANPLTDAERDTLDEIAKKNRSKQYNNPALQGTLKGGL